MTRCSNRRRRLELEMAMTELLYLVLCTVFLTTFIMLRCTSLASAWISDLVASKFGLGSWSKVTLNDQKIDNFSSFFRRIARWAILCVIIDFRRIDRCVFLGTIV
jgi:hypothetical protein